MIHRGAYGESFGHVMDDVRDPLRVGGVARSLQSAFSGLQPVSFLSDKY